MTVLTTRKWAEKPDTKKNLWAFPVNCQNCGIRLLGAAKQICRYCILSELVRIYPEPKKGVYPEGVEWQIACWRYDEAHLIQRLMHHLKYNAVYDIGVDMGRAAAELFQQVHPKNTENLCLSDHYWCQYLFLSRDGVLEDIIKVMV
jgi:predicted amidophosphoribosyltransferase